jgi:lipoate-protein ligase B
VDQSNKSAAIEILDLGLTDYQDALAYQQNLHQQVVQGTHPGAILLVEHPPVITLGNRGNRQFLRASEGLLGHLEIPVVKTDRGGEVTAHEPGQLVVYPVINLARTADAQLGPRAFVALLETVVIRWLAQEGVVANTDPINPGVWVGMQKICALGIRFKDRATYHGLALNLNNTLATFQAIVPCGIEGRGVTSLHTLTGRSYDLSQVGQAVAGALRDGLAGRQP